LGDPASLKKSRKHINYSCRICNFEWLFNPKTWSQRHS